MASAKFDGDAQRRALANSSVSAACLRHVSALCGRCSRVPLAVLAPLAARMRACVVHNPCCSFSRRPMTVHCACLMFTAGRV